MIYYVDKEVQSIDFICAGGTLHCDDCTYDYDLAKYKLRVFRTEVLFDPFDTTFHIQSEKDMVLLKMIADILSVNLISEDKLIREMERGLNG